MIFLLISVSSFKCTTTSCISGSTHQQLQYQCVLGASASQHSNQHYSGIQGEIASYRLMTTLSVSRYDVYFCFQDHQIVMQP